MSFNARYNALDQELDIKGSERQEDTRTLLDELNQLGHVVGAGNSAASLIAGAPAGQMRASSSLAIFSSASLTDWLSVSGAASGSNNGTFLIVNLVSPNVVDVINASAIVPDPNNGTITVQERQPYALEDDLNFARTRDKAIKGTANWYDGIPTYVRADATTTQVTASLQNIAGKTTDAKALAVNRQIFGAIIVSGSAQITYTSAGNLKHATGSDSTGIPTFDAGPYVGDYNSCFVAVLDVNSDNELQVLSGTHVGEVIYGMTFSGSSTSPNSVEIHWFSRPHGGDPSTTSTAYSWEAGQPLTASLTYGFYQRIDQMDGAALRKIEVLGIQTDAQLKTHIDNINTAVGTTTGAVSLAGLLTNTGANFEFNILSATPSVVSALNALNSGTGDRTYTGPYLTSDVTIAESLQQLSNAIVANSGSSGVHRFITRLTGAIPAGTPVPTPQGYVLDGTFNGKTLVVFTRGLLRDPGVPANGDDYTESSTGSVVFYAAQKKNDHINWLFM